MDPRRGVGRSVFVSSAIDLAISIYLHILWRAICIQVMRQLDAELGWDMEFHHENIYRINLSSFRMEVALW